MDVEVFPYSSNGHISEEEIPYYKYFFMQIIIIISYICIPF